MSIVTILLHNDSSSNGFYFAISQSLAGDTLLGLPDLGMENTEDSKKIVISMQNGIEHIVK